MSPVDAIQAARLVARSARRLSTRRARRPIETRSPFSRLRMVDAMELSVDAEAGAGREIQTKLATTNAPQSTRRDRRGPRIAMLRPPSRSPVGGMVRRGPTLPGGALAVTGGFRFRLDFAREKKGPNSPVR